MENNNNDTTELINKLLKELGADKCAIQTDENKDNSSLLFMLLVMMLSGMNQPSYDIKMLEKELSHLKGKVEVLEKLITDK